MARDEVRRHYRGDNYVLTSDYEDADVLAKVKNVDGTGSGLDADTVDGVEAAAFQLLTGKDANSGYVGRGSSGQASIPYLDLPEQTGATPSADVGRIYGLDVGAKTEMEYRDSDGVVGRPFRDSWFVAQNTTGSTIAKGAVVRVSGQSASGIPLIALADADASATMPAGGLAMESIANNAYGRVMVMGILTGLATTGLTAGAPVYASGTAGAFTGTAPVYPAYRQVLGSVMSVNATTGEIFVNVAHFFRQVGVPILVTFFYGSTLSATTGVGRAPITTNTAGTVTEVRLTVNSAPSAGAITVGIRKNGAAAFTSPTIAQSAFAGSVTGLSTAVAAGDYLTADISGTLTGASDLVVTVEIMTAN